MDTLGGSYHFVSDVALPGIWLPNRQILRKPWWLPGRPLSRDEREARDAVMPAAFVAERAKGTGTAAASYNVTVASITTGNHLIILVVVGIPASGSCAVTSVTDNAAGGSNTYTVDVGTPSVQITSVEGCYICSGWIDPGKGAPTQLTINISVTATIAWKVEEFSGLNSTGWFDTGQVAAGQTTTAQTSPSATPARSGELAVGGFVVARIESAWTVGAIGSQTSVQAGTTRNANPDLAFEYVLSCDAGSQTAAGTWATAPATTASSKDLIAFYEPPPKSLVGLANRAQRRFARR